MLYELINEPYSPTLQANLGLNQMAATVFPILYGSNGLYDRTIAAIRANGDSKICIVDTVAGDMWGKQGNDNITYPVKLSDSNVLYGTHWVLPTKTQSQSMSWYDSLVNMATQFSVNNNVPMFIGEWGIPWRLTTLNVTEQTCWTQDQCQTYNNLGFSWCYWDLKSDCYSIYYSDIGSNIQNYTFVRCQHITILHARTANLTTIISDKKSNTELTVLKIVCNMISYRYLMYIFLRFLNQKFRHQTSQLMTH